MSQEDKLVNTMIEEFRSTNAEVEVPYNHFGSRGVVDLVLVDYKPPEDEEVKNYSEKYLVSEDSAKKILREKSIRVIEAKSESAIRQATGANEVLRQFKRHKQYFFDGSDYSNEGAHATFMLVFEFTKWMYDHVKQNKNLYASAYNSEYENGGGHLMWLSPDTNHGTVLFNNSHELLPYETVEEMQANPQ